MKSIKTVLTAALILAVVGSGLAFKANRSTLKLFHPSEGDPTTCNVLVKTVTTGDDITDDDAFIGSLSSTGGPCTSVQYANE